MSQYSDIFDGVISWTNKPLRIVETDMAIRAAVRAAHKLGKFHRDLITVNINNIPIEAVQSVDYVTPCPRLRQLARVTKAGTDFEYEIIDLLDLTDQDGYLRTDVCYGIGNKLNIRASNPVDSIDVTYYQYPDVSNLTLLNDWLCANHTDLIINMAAALVLTTTGEQEVRSKVEALAEIGKADLISDSLELIGR